MVKWLFWWPNSEIWKVSNLELKVSNYGIKRFTFDYKENLYDTKKDFGNRKDLHDRELSTLWCSKETYSQHFLQRFILFRLNLV